MILVSVPVVLRGTVPLQFSKPSTLRFREECRPIEGRMPFSEARAGKPLGGVQLSRPLSPNPSNEAKEANGGVKNASSSLDTVETYGRKRSGYLTPA